MIRNALFRRQQNSNVEVAVRPLLATGKAAVHVDRQSFWYGLQNRVSSRIKDGLPFAFGHEGAWVLPARNRCEYHYKGLQRWPVSGWSALESRTAGISLYVIDSTVNSVEEEMEAGVRLHRRAGQRSSYVFNPPSTLMMAPVMCLAAGLA